MSIPVDPKLEGTAAFLTHSGKAACLRDRRPADNLKEGAYSKRTV